DPDGSLARARTEGKVGSSSCALQELSIAEVCRPKMELDSPAYPGWDRDMGAWSEGASLVRLCWQLFGLHVIVVDDDADSPAAMLRLLGDFGAVDFGAIVRTAPGGIEALAMVCRECPELVLTDLRMPGMSGGELLNRLRDRHPPETFPSLRFPRPPSPILCN